VAHKKVLQLVETALEKQGLSVVAEAHCLAKDDNRYFGLLQVVNGVPDGQDYGRVVGIRNSHDKAFAAGICAGAGVFVCSNLSFSGEIQFARKHTSRVIQSLPSIVDRAIEMLKAKWTRNDLRFRAYKDKFMTAGTANDLVINFLDAGAICASRIPKVLAEYRQPRHEEFDTPTVWSLFNAVTQANKGSNPHTLPVRTMKLQTVCDAVSGVR